MTLAPLFMLPASSSGTSNLRCAGEVFLSSSWVRCSRGAIPCGWKDVRAVRYFMGAALRRTDPWLRIGFDVWSLGREASLVVAGGCAHIKAYVRRRRCSGRDQSHGQRESRGRAGPSDEGIDGWTRGNGARRCVNNSQALPNESPGEQEPRYSITLRDRQRRNPGHAERRGGGTFARQHRLTRDRPPAAPGACWWRSIR